MPGSHWSVKDYIAHLCTIDGLIAPGFAAQVGQSAPFPDIPFPNDIATRFVGSWADDINGHVLEDHLTNDGIKFEHSVCRTSRTTGFAIASCAKAGVAATKARHSTGTMRFIDPSVLGGNA